MFSSTNSRPKPKVHMTSAALPPYIDPVQPPTKRSPWRQMRETPFVRTVTLVMPEEVVMLTLTDILTNTDGWWWTNVQLMMLSEGRPGVDEGRFEIREGKLRMELSKETYEKCGLQGKPLVDGGGGRKHMKARYEVQVDLRGKKKGRGLDRVEGEARSLRGVKVPEKVFLVGEEGDEEERQQYEEDWYEVVEWLDMVALDSDGVKDDGCTDSYVSRYKVPADSKITDLRVVRWAGLLSWTWIIALLIEIVKRSKAAHVESWLAVSVASHRTEAVGQVDGYTVVLQSTSSASTGSVRGQREEEEKGKGFQRSRCFQFVDSNTC
ncbi:hypothetical protein DV736_g6063, partial [Chaetothyriales sp. CBS 134916]